MNPISCSIILFSFGIPAVWVWSNTINPNPPTRNMNDDDSPAIVIYVIITNGTYDKVWAKIISAEIILNLWLLFITNLQQCIGRLFGTA